MDTLNKEYKEEMSRKELEKYVKDWSIFIDTCSLLDENADKFWSNIVPLLSQYQKKQ